MKLVLKEIARQIGTRDNIEQAVCAVLAILSLFLIGEKNILGMVFGLLSEVAWTSIFLRKRLFILCLVNAVYIFLYARGFLLWLI